MFPWPQRIKEGTVSNALYITLAAFFSVSARSAFCFLVRSNFRTAYAVAQAGNCRYRHAY